MEGEKGVGRLGMERKEGRQGRREERGGGEWRRDNRGEKESGDRREWWGTGVGGC